MGRQRGFSIGTILAIGLVCLMVGFVVACLCTFQLNAASQAQNTEQALHLAEGAIAMTVSHVHDGLVNSNPYGLHQEDVVYTPDPTQPDQFGEVSFNNTSPWGWSTADYDGSHTTGWQNASVPQSTVHLVARGVVGNKNRILEVLVAVPNFQYVLATDGPLQSSAPLDVKGEPTMGALASDPLLTSNLGANVGSNVLVSAASNSFVSGDVVCAGSVTLNAPSTVLGTVRNGQITTPRIPITNFNTSGPGTPTLAGTVPGPVALTTNTYCAGPLTIQGDLKLTNSTLYVEGGPLVVNGALNGTGAVFVHGSVQVNGGADLDASNMVALLATGGVSLTGTPGLAKYFQGLVYTEGPFAASDITIAGAFVAATAASSVTLGSNTQVVYVPGATSMVASATTPAGPAVPLSAVAPQDGLVFNGGVPTYYDNQMPATGWTPCDISTGTPSNPAIYTAIMAALGGNPDFQNWLQYTNGGQSFISTGNVMMGNANSYQVAVNAVVYNATTNQFDVVTPPEVFYGSGQCGLTPVTQAQFDAAAAQQGTSSARLVPLLTQAQLIYRTTANQLLSGSAGTTGTGPSTATLPGLNLNNYFLSDKDPIRIVVWREH